MGNNYSWDKLGVLGGTPENEKRKNPYTGNVDYEKAQANTVLGDYMIDPSKDSSNVSDSTPQTQTTDLGKYSDMWVDTPTQQSTPTFKSRDDTPTPNDDTYFKNKNDNASFFQKANDWLNNSFLGRLGKNIETKQPENDFNKGFSTNYYKEDQEGPSWGNVIGHSLAQGTYGALEGFENLPRVAYKYFAGNPNDSVMQALDNAYNYLDNKSQEHEKQLKDIDTYTGKGFVKAGLEAIPQVATAFIPGGLLGKAGKAAQLGPKALTALEMTPFGMQAAGNYASEAEKEGASTGQQLGYGLASGVLEMASEAPVFKGIAKIFGKGATESLINSGANTLLGKYGKLGLEYVKNIGKEMAQEAFIDPATGLAKKAIYKPDMNWTGENGVWDNSQMLQDAWGGAAMGVIMGALGLPVHTLSHKMANHMIENNVQPTPEILNEMQNQMQNDIQTFQAPEVNPGGNAIPTNGQEQYPSVFNTPNLNIQNPPQSSNKYKINNLDEFVNNDGPQQDLNTMLDVYKNNVDGPNQEITQNSNINLTDQSPIENTTQVTQPIVENAAPTENTTPIENTISDDLYKRAVDEVINNGVVSTGFIQKKLNLPFNQAESIINRMENEKIISPKTDSGRSVLVKPTDVQNNAQTTPQVNETIENNTNVPIKNEVSQNSPKEDLKTPTEIKPGGKYKLRNLGEVTVKDFDGGLITAIHKSGNEIKIGRDSFNNLRTDNVAPVNQADKQQVSVEDLKDEDNQQDMDKHSDFVSILNEKEKAKYNKFLKSGKTFVKFKGYTPLVKVVKDNGDTIDIEFFSSKKDTYPVDTFVSYTSDYIPKKLREDKNDTTISDNEKLNTKVDDLHNINYGNKVEDFEKEIDIARENMFKANEEDNGKEEKYNLDLFQKLQELEREHENGNKTKSIDQLKQEIRANVDEMFSEEGAAKLKEEQSVHYDNETGKKYIDRKLQEYKNKKEIKKLQEKLTVETDKNKKADILSEIKKLKDDNLVLNHHHEFTLSDLSENRRNEIKNTIKHHKKMIDEGKEINIDNTENKIRPVEDRIVENHHMPKDYESTSKITIRGAKGDHAKAKYELEKNITLTFPDNPNRYFKYILRDTGFVRIVDKEGSTTWQTKDNEITRLMSHLIVQEYNKSLNNNKYEIEMSKDLDSMDLADLFMAKAISQVKGYKGASTAGDGDTPSGRAVNNHLARIKVVDKAIKKVVDKLGYYYAPVIPDTSANVKHFVFDSKLLEKWKDFLQKNGCFIQKHDTKTIEEIENLVESLDTKKTKQEVKEQKPSKVAEDPKSFDEAVKDELTRQGAKNISIMHDQWSHTISVMFSVNGIYEDIKITGGGKVTHTDKSSLEMQEAIDNVKKYRAEEGLLKEQSNYEKSFKIGAIAENNQNAIRSKINYELKNAYDISNNSKPIDNQDKKAGKTPWERHSNQNTLDKFLTEKTIENGKPLTNNEMVKAIKEFDPAANVEVKERQAANLDWEALLKAIDPYRKVTKINGEKVEKPQEQQKETTEEKPVELNNGDIINWKGENWRVADTEASPQYIGQKEGNLIRLKTTDRIVGEVKTVDKSELSNVKIISKATTIKEHQQENHIAEAGQKIEYKIGDLVWNNETKVVGKYLGLNEKGQMVFLEQGLPVNGKVYWADESLEPYNNQDISVEGKPVTHNDLIREVKTSVLNNKSVLNSVKNSDEQNSLITIENAIKDAQDDVMSKYVKVKGNGPALNGMMAHYKKGSNTLESTKNSIYNKLQEQLKSENIEKPVTHDELVQKVIDTAKADERFSKWINANSEEDAKKVINSTLQKEVIPDIVLSYKNNDTESFKAAIHELLTNKNDIRSILTDKIYNDIKDETKDMDKSDNVDNNHVNKEYKTGDYFEELGDHPGIHKITNIYNDGIRDIIQTIEINDRGNLPLGGFNGASDKWIPLTKDKAMKKIEEYLKSYKDKGWHDVIRKTHELIGDFKSNKESQEIATQVTDWLKNKHKFTSQELFTVADKAYNGTQTENKYSVKDAYDSMELGVNQYLLNQKEVDLKAKDTETVKNNIKWIKENVLDLLPTQTKRTDEQMQYQQFSTPPTIAYLVNWIGNVNKGDTVLEPSAGIGGLAVFSKIDGAKVIVNELSERRLEVLKNMGFDGYYNENAEQIDNILPYDVKPTVIEMNPPFSSTQRMKNKNDTKNATMHIEQALNRLEEGGRLVAIVGQGMSEDAATFKKWWKDIKSKYNVRANVGLGKSDFVKYGTGFGTQIFIIDKTGPTNEKTITGNFNNLNEIIDKLEGIQNDRQRVASKNKDSELTSNKQGSIETTKENASRDNTNEPIHSTDDTVGDGNRKVESSNEPGSKNSDGDNSKSIPGKNKSKQGNDDVNRAGTNTGSNEKSEQNKGAAESSGLSDRDTTENTDGSSNNELDINVKSKAEQKKNNKNDLGDSVYSNYEPQKLKIPGSKPHPGQLAQSAAMAAVDPPDPTYKPNLPKDLISSGKLSIAQLETTVYAGQAHNQTLPNGYRKGFFIGDGTGVGKGREISSIILDNFRQGRKKAIWISKNKDLYQDAQRDWGSLDQDVEQVTNLSKYKVGTKVDKKDGIVFTTYGTIPVGLDYANSKDNNIKPGDLKSRIEQLVDWVGKDFDGVVVFDEAHQMANAGDGKREGTKAAQAGILLQERLPNARIVYASATGATDVSNLAYANRLGLWGTGTSFADVNDFVSKINEGGLAAMELVSRDMKSMGSYISRNLSYDGVNYENLTHNLTADQKEMYDTMAEGWQIILKNMDKALEITNQKKNSRAKAYAKGRFWSANQRFFNQFMTTLSMPAVLKDMEERLNNGEAVVVQLVNTNQAEQERQLAKIKAEEGTLDDIDLSSKGTLLQYLEKAFPTTQYEEYVDDDGKKHTRIVTDKDGNPVLNREALKLKEQLMEMIGSLKIPEGPIDMIINKFGVNNVAEITGRNKRVVIENGKKKEQKLTPSHRTADTNAFMDDKKRILIFSDAGGTGRSYHAEKGVKNQRHRIHYLLQAGWEAKKAVQGFGRTHRSNEASAPTYVLVSTDLRGQKRFISTIARRLDQLGALTKGQRQAGSSGMFKASDNLENDIAKNALYNFYKNIARDKYSDIKKEQFFDQTGLSDKLLDEYGNLKEKSEELKDVPHFLNRILSLKSDFQNKVFDTYASMVEDMTEYAKENGLLDTGLENLKADKIRIVESKDILKNENGVTSYHQLELSHKTVPLSFGDIMDHVPSQRIGFYQNKASKRIYAIYKAGTRTLNDGRVIDMVRLFTQEDGKTNKVAFRDIEGNKNYEKLKDNEAAQLWDEAVKKIPEYDKEKVHLISGTLLPIWDRLPSGNMKVVRALTDEGDMLLGRVIPESKIDSVLRRLGSERTKENVNTADVIDKILNKNFSANLVNGWKLQRKKVAGEYRIEIVGNDLYKYREQLKNEGAFTETIQYSTRYFIPTGEEGVKVLDNITKYRPIDVVLPPENDLNINLQTHSHKTDLSSSTGIDINALSRNNNHNDEKYFEERTGRAATEEDKKERQTIVNSFMNSEAIPQEVKDLLKEHPEYYKYIQHENKQTQEKAREYVERNLNQAIAKIKNLKGLNNDMDTAIALEIERKFIEDGDFEAARDWSLRVAKLGTEAGRAVQYFSTLKRMTPDWSLNRMQKEINKITTQEQMDKLEKKSSSVADVVNEVNGKVVDDVINEVNKKAKKEYTPEEILAKKISSHVKETKLKDDPVKNMINTLYRVAQQTLPPKVTFKKTPLDFIKDAMNNAEEYKDTWKKAKEIVAKKYKNNKKAKDLLDDYFNQFLDKPFSNKQLTAAVKQAIKENNIDLSKLVRDHYTKVDEAGQSLADKLTISGLDEAQANELAEYIKNEFAEQSNIRKERILSAMFKENPNKKGKQEFYKRVIELSNLGAFSNEKYKEAVANKYNIPYLSGESTKKIIELSNEIQKHNPDSRAAKEAQFRLLDYMDSLMPMSKWRIIGSYQTIAMLMNTKTAIRNTVANALFRQFTNLKDIIRTGIDKAVSIGTGERTSVLPSRKTQRKGMKEGINDAILDFKHGVNTKNINDKLEMRGMRTFGKSTSKNPLIKGADKAMSMAERVTSLLMDDRPFEGAAYADAIRKQEELAKLNGTEFNIAEAREKAKKEAVYTTFNDETIFSKKLLGLKRSLNELTYYAANNLTGNKVTMKQSKRNAGWGLGDVVVKFARTPANIFMRAIDYSPVSLIKALGHATRTGFKESKNFNQETFVDDLAKGLTGGAIIGLGILLAKMGAIILDRDDDKDKAATDQQTGIGQFKINLSAVNRAFNTCNLKNGGLKPGDFLVSYDWATPLATVLTIGAAIEKARSEQDKKSVTDMLSVIAQSSNAGINALLAQPFTQGIENMFSSYNKDFGSRLGKVASGVPQSFVPTMLNQIKQIVDNGSRQTYSDDPMEKVKRSIMNRVPGLSSELPQKIDTLGEPQKTYQNDTNSVFNVFFNPAITTNYLPRKAEEIAQNIYEKAGEKKQFPRVVDDKISIGSKDRETFKLDDKTTKLQLTPEEYQKYAQYIGQETAKAIEKHEKILNGSYDDVVYQVIVRQIQNDMTKIGKDAKNMILSERTGVQVNKKNFDDKNTNQLDVDLINTNNYNSNGTKKKSSSRNKSSSAPMQFGK